VVVVVVGCQDEEIVQGAVLVSKSENRSMSAQFRSNTRKQKHEPQRECIQCGWCGIRGSSMLCWAN
jgi:hypothetical protein